MTDNQVMLMCVLGFFAALGVVGLTYILKRDLVKHRIIADKLSEFCRDIGAPHFSKFFKAFALDDGKTMLQEGHALVGIIEDDKLRAGAIENIVVTCLQKAAGNKELTAKYLAALGLQPGTLETAKTAAQASADKAKELLPLVTDAVLAQQAAKQ